MKAKVYYLNSNLDKDAIKCKFMMGIHKDQVDKDALKQLDWTEVEIVDVEPDTESLESVYEFMNNLSIPVGHPKRKVFESAGHTSMSMGDMIRFETDDSTLEYIVASFGFIKV